MRTATTQYLQQLKNAWASLGKQYNAKKTGFFGTPKREGFDYMIIATIGQKEITEYDTGKEKLIFHDLWFGGEYALGVRGNSSDLNGSFFTILGNFSYKLHAKGDGVSLDKGSFYGAVKYNNTWRLARITKDK